MRIRVVIRRFTTSVSYRSKPLVTDKITYTYREVVVPSYDEAKMHLCMFMLEDEQQVDWNYTYIIPNQEWTVTDEYTPSERIVRAPVIPAVIYAYLQSDDTDVSYGLKAKLLDYDIN